MFLLITTKNNGNFCVMLKNSNTKLTKESYKTLRSIPPNPNFDSWNSSRNLPQTIILMLFGVNNQILFPFRLNLWIRYNWSKNTLKWEKFWKDSEHTTNSFFVTDWIQINSCKKYKKKLVFKYLSRVEKQYNCIIRCVPLIIHYSIPS